MADRDEADILKAVHSLQKHNPLRLQVEVVLANPSAAVDDLKPIVAAFGHSKFQSKSEQIAAAWLIANAHWSPVQRTELSNQLCRHMVYTRSISQGGGVAYQISYYIILVSVAIVSLLMYFNAHGHFIMAWAIVLFSVLFTPYNRSLKLNQSRLLLRSLGKLADPASLGTIA